MLELSYLGVFQVDAVSRENRVFGVRERGRRDVVDRPTVSPLVVSECRRPWQAATNHQRPLVEAMRNRVGAKDIVIAKMSIRGLLVSQGSLSMAGGYLAFSALPLIVFLHP